MRARCAPEDLDLGSVELSFANRVVRPAVTMLDNLCTCVDHTKLAQVITGHDSPKCS